MGNGHKMAIFADFDPVNRKNEKNEIAYHVEKKIIKFSQNILKNVILTSL